MIAHFAMARIAIPCGVTGLAVLASARRNPKPSSFWNASEWAVAFIAGGAIATLVLVCFNHWHFPGYLETMEGTVLQHVLQITHGSPIYPRPSITYVPLAYNPGFYFLAAPFVGILGPHIATLRLVAMLGIVASAGVMFVAVRRLTGSAWWALVSVGCLAAAYRIMDTALDNAHADSWLLATALIGTEVIDRATTRWGRVLGILLLVLSFWMKQHGVLFAFGGLGYLTWRLGVRRALPYWALVALVGGVLYLGAFTWPFGAFFHYFTWSVPSSWSILGVSTLTRVAVLAVLAYPLLILAAANESVWAFSDARHRITAWHTQFLVAVLSAVMGGLDAAGSDNVFIPFGGFTIVLGVVGLWRLFGTQTFRIPSRWARPGAAVLAAITLAILLYDPRDVMMPNADARVARADLLTMLGNMDGPVYVPSMGYIEGPQAPAPQPVWVALDDIVRGRRRTASDTAIMWEGLAAVIRPTHTPAYVLANTPLDRVPGPVSLIAPCYTLDHDYGERFTMLKGPVKHFFPDWPRYLYRYDATTPACQTTLSAVPPASPASPAPLLGSR